MKIMKAKYALIALLTVTFFGCDDNTAGLGLGMFPGSDQGINGKLSTFDVITSSIPTGRIYAKTNIGYVGKFTDNTFGAYQAGFLATLNCPDGLTFPAIYEEAADGKSATGTMVKEAADDITLFYDKPESDPSRKVIGNIHTVELYLWYDSYFGDSLTACRLSVYELNKKLELNSGKDVYYTDIKPELYYNSTDLLGTKAYTAVDLSVKDSIRNLSTYVPSVHLNLEKEIAKKVGGEILTEARNKGSKFDNESFLKKFPGIYVKSDYGDGTVLYISQVQMNVVYKCYAVDEKTGVKLKRKAKDHVGKDSTYYAYRPFNSTREVIQANRLSYTNTDKIDALIKEGNNTYLKSPAGIFTQAELPISKIGKDLEQDSLNAVKLTFSNYNQSSDKKFGMSIPQTVMLIRYKYKDSFFEKNQLPDDISSFLTPHSSSTNQYTFYNITTLINACIADRKAAEEELHKTGKITLVDIKDENGTPITQTNDIVKWEELTNWDKVVLIPVLATYDNSNSSYGGTPNVISVQHDLKPGYVRLKGGSLGNDPSEEVRNKYILKLEVVSTSFAN